MPQANILGRETCQNGGQRGKHSFSTVGRIERKSRTLQKFRNPTAYFRINPTYCTTTVIDVILSVQEEEKEKKKKRSGQEIASTYPEGSSLCFIRLLTRQIHLNPPHLEFPIFSLLSSSYTSSSWRHFEHTSLCPPPSCASARYSAETLHPAERCIKTRNTRAYSLHGLEIAFLAPRFP